MIRAAFDTLFGLMRIGWLVASSGFKLRGPYWAWRWHTAFGAGPEPTGWAKCRAVMDYARWVHRMHP